MTEYTGEAFRVHQQFLSVKGTVCGYHAKKTDCPIGCGEYKPWCSGVGCDGPLSQHMVGSCSGGEDVSTNVESSGGSRFSSGKPGRFWQGPLLGLMLVAPVWTKGGEKYAPRDWAEGQSFSLLIDCAFRHMLKLIQKGPLAKDDGDGGTGAYHAAAVVWNLLCLLTFIVLGRTDVDDVTPWYGVTADMVTKIAEDNGVLRENVTAEMVRRWSGESQR